MFFIKKNILVKSNRMLKTGFLLLFTCKKKISLFHQRKERRTQCEKSGYESKEVREGKEMEGKK